MTYSKRFSSKFFARLLKPEGQNPIRDRATSFEIIFIVLHSWHVLISIGFISVGFFVNL